MMIKLVTIYILCTLLEFILDQKSYLAEVTCATVSLYFS